MRCGDYIYLIYIVPTDTFLTKKENVKMYKPKHQKSLKTQVVTYFDIVSFISELLSSLDVDSFYDVEDGTLDQFLEYLNDNKHPWYNYEKHED